MKQKIKNALKIKCEDVDLETVSNIEFYLRQGKEMRVYLPTVIDSHTMLVTIPYEDAMVLGVSPARMQFAFTDAEGNPRASEIVTRPVGELLKEAGYDPV